MCETLIPIELNGPPDVEEVLKCLGRANRKFHFNLLALITAISLFLPGGAAVGLERIRTERVRKS